MCYVMGGATCIHVCDDLDPEYGEPACIVWLYYAMYLNFEAVFGLFFCLVCRLA